MPKGDGGVRQFHFCEVHLWILYYSIGFYFLDLTKAVRNQLHTSQCKASIQTFYGANIRQDNPEGSQIHYQEDYQSFTSSIRQTVRQQVQEHKVAVLHLDIQDFFRTIDHTQFTRVLGEQSLPESKLRLHYDEQTQLTIREILFLIVQRSEGLPLSPQNIVSNLLSHLFLYPLDCCIHEIQIDSNPLLTFHRYVDDMFITVPFSFSEDNGDIGAKMIDISTRIGEHLSSKLGLSLNPLKTRLDIISSEEEADDLIERSRLVSFYRPLPDDEGGEPPQIALERAITVLVKLKEAFQNNGYVARLDANDDIALKQCFHKAVVQYTQSAQARQEIEGVFLQNWHPALMPKSIKVLVFLISRVSSIFNDLISHVYQNLIHESPPLTTIHLAEHLMLSDEYINDKQESDPQYGVATNEMESELVRLLQSNDSSYIRLLNRLLTPSPALRQPYVEIEDSCLQNHQSLMQQVRRAVVAERRGVHGLAYNHLLNVLQEWCFCHHQPEIARKKYGCKEVLEWLDTVASHSEIVFVMTMFDRRNRNAISHPGDEGLEVALVTPSEYENHLVELNILLKNSWRRLQRNRQR